MSVAWLFQKDAFPATPDLAAEADKQGFPVKFVDARVADDDNSYLDLFPKRSCVIFHGTEEFARRMRRECYWIPGAIAHLDKFLFNEYFGALVWHMPSP